MPLDPAGLDLILREAPATPEAIAHRIYKGLGPAYMPYALDSVLAHLHKLEAERRASGQRGPREFTWDELFADM